VLNHVQCRLFGVKPARKRPRPAPIGLPHVKLDERAGQLVRLPRRGALARAQMHDRVAIAQRLSGAHLQFPGLAVALVEQPQHRHAFGHRRRAFDHHLDGAGVELNLVARLIACPAGHRQRDARTRRGRGRCGALLPRAPAEPARNADHHRDQQGDARPARIHASGLHAS